MEFKPGPTGCTCSDTNKVKVAGAPDVSCECTTVQNVWFLSDETIRSKSIKRPGCSVVSTKGGFNARPIFSYGETKPIEGGEFLCSNYNLVGNPERFIRALLRAEPDEAHGLVLAALASNKDGFKNVLAEAVLEVPEAFRAPILAAAQPAIEFLLEKGGQPVPRLTRLVKRLMQSKPPEEPRGACPAIISSAFARIPRAATSARTELLRHPCG